MLPPEELIEKKESTRVQYYDPFAMETARLSFLRGAYPHESRYRSWIINKRIIYVGEGRILPLGDNRDNSRDGRIFGTVKTSKILGKGAFKYWPLNRLGGIY